MTKCPSEDARQHRHIRTVDAWIKATWPLLAGLYTTGSADLCTASDKFVGIEPAYWESDEWKAYLALKGPINVHEVV